VPEEPNAKLPQAVAEAALSAGLPDVAVCADVAEALDGLIAADQGEGPRRLLICGSLYLAGAVLAENG
jgi:dihydrofolate synthase/folylpolyglutamate synthase